MWPTDNALILRFFRRVEDLRAIVEAVDPPGVLTCSILWPRTTPPSGPVCVVPALADVKALVVDVGVNKVLLLPMR